MDEASAWLSKPRALSKNRVTQETLQLLLRLTDSPGLRERIDAMVSGEKINVTEDRSVLHAAL